MKQQKRLTYRERKELKKDINGEYTTKILKRSALALCLFSTIYFGQGVLKSFGEIENKNTARKKGVPVIEQSYTNYLCLGAKNLAEKVYSPLK